MNDLATNRRARRPAGGGGFTLIELIAIMVITAVLAAVSVPAFSNLADTRGVSASRMLLRDMTFARQRAVATGTTTWVVFDAGAHSWSILAEDPDNTGRAAATVLNDPATGRVFTQTLNAGDFNGVQMTAINFDSQDEIGFDWLGRPLNATEATMGTTGSVVLTGNHVVVVSMETGHVIYVAP